MRFLFVLHGEHRRHLHAQQLAARAGSDEGVLQFGSAAGDAVLDGIERVQQQVAVEHTVDRAPKADEVSTGGQARSVFRRATQGTGARVVEQDATVEVAHHHALRELRHQRGKSVALVFDVATGGADLGLDVAQQRVALVGEFIDRGGKRLHFGRTHWFEAEIAVGVEHQPLLLGHAEQALDVMAEQLTDDDDADHKGDRREQTAQRCVRAEQFDELRLLFGPAFRPDDERSEQEWAADEQCEHRHSGEKTRIGVHDQPSASRLFTLSTSSRVENGLVM